MTALMDYVDMRGDAECWPWTAHRDAKGYGRFGARPTRRAHRVMLEGVLGRKMARNEFACHTCDNPWCCNPTHLYAGDAKTNARDKTDRLRHHNTLKTHCPAGHAYEGANVQSQTARGGRVRGRRCRECGRTEAREYQRRRRAEARRG